MARLRRRGYSTVLCVSSLLRNGHAKRCSVPFQAALPPASVGVVAKQTHASLDWRVRTNNATPAGGGVVGLLVGLLAAGLLLLAWRPSPPTPLCTKRKPPAPSAHCCQPVLTCGCGSPTTRSPSPTHAPPPPFPAPLPGPVPPRCRFPRRARTRCSGHGGVCLRHVARAPARRHACARPMRMVDAAPTRHLHALQPHWRAGQRRAATSSSSSSSARP